MRVKEVMSNNPFYLQPSHTLEQAAQKMNEYNCGYMPIGKDERLVGVITDRDIAIRAVAEGCDPSSTPVEQYMSPNIWYCYEDDNIEKAAQSMEDLQVRRLIVLDAEKQFRGILSIGDIANKCHDSHLCGELLEKVSEWEH